MADVKKVATRVSYGEALVELGNERDDFVVLDADLAAATQTGKFKAAHPERFYDAGIAESNLMCRRHCDHGPRCFCEHLCHVRCRPRVRASS